jgi:uncharacterized protein YijF (DUF1287 family)
MKKPPKRKPKPRAAHKARERRGVPVAQRGCEKEAHRPSIGSGPATSRSTAAVVPVHGRADDVFKLGLATLPLLLAAALLLPPDIQIWRRAALVATTAPVVETVRSAPVQPITIRADRETVAASAPVQVELGPSLSGEALSAAPGAATVFNAGHTPSELQWVHPRKVISAATGGTTQAIGGAALIELPAAGGYAIASQPAGPVIASVDAAGPALNSACSLDEHPRRLPAFQSTTSPQSVPLGLRIAEAARAQTTQFVIYSDRYFGLSYPMGDVPALYGVCTDVVIRALRAVGIDLQVLVREAKLGRGDASIDHRRTEVLRRYFEKSGYGLPVTDLPEDYAPGDIVTYLRPQNPRVQSHIAVVSDVIGPSGRPMIVHNRGWGPQLEDALFADAISGHYRWGVTSTAPPADMVSTAPPVSRSRPLRTTAGGRAAKSEPLF